MYKNIKFNFKEKMKTAPLSPLSQIYDFDMSIFKIRSKSSFPSIKRFIEEEKQKESNYTKPFFPLSIMKTPDKK